MTLNRITNRAATLYPYEAITRRIFPICVAAGALTCGSNIYYLRREGHGDTIPAAIRMSVLPAAVGGIVGAGTAVAHPVIAAGAVLLAPFWIVDNLMTSPVSSPLR